MATKKFSIRDTTMVPYPQDELDELKKLTELDGILGDIYDNTGVTAPTVRSILKDGKGQFAKVKALKEFVIKFNTAVRA